MSLSAICSLIYLLNFPLSGSLRSNFSYMFPYKDFLQHIQGHIKVCSGNIYHENTDTVTLLSMFLFYLSQLKINESPNIIINQTICVIYHIKKIIAAPFYCFYLSHKHLCTLLYPNSICFITTSSFSTFLTYPLP